MNPSGAEYEFSVVGPFEWLRVDAQVPWHCSSCGQAQAAVVPVFVEWLDRDGALEQARFAQGLTCARCEWLEPLDLPLLQYRQADAIGLMVGLPPRTARADDEVAIRDTLAVAHSKRKLEGAGVVAAVRMGWWQTLWSRPLGPPLAGAVPLPLPESTEEVERWRTATVAALGLPDVGAALREFIGSEDEDAALETFDRRPELASPRWRHTVDTVCERLREDQKDPRTRAVVVERIALLRQLRLIGSEWVRRRAVGEELDSLIAIASANRGSAEALAALDSLVDMTDGVGDGPLAVAARLAYLQALHGDPSRSARTGVELVSFGRETLELARNVVGDEHEMTRSAALNLAVCVEESAAGDSESALREAYGLLADLAPRVARSGSSPIVGVATNLAALAHRGPSAHPERAEEAAALVAEASHIRKLLGGGRRRDAIVELVDEAASLRSKVSGSLLENAKQAVARLREALDREDEWRVLSLPERAIIRLNLANALGQLRSRAPQEAAFEEVRDAALEAIAAGAVLDRENPVAIQTCANAGATLIRLHTEFTAAGREPPRMLWQEGSKALERAFAASKEVYLAHHPHTLMVALNLATAYGAVVDRELADRERCSDLLAYVIEHSRPHEAEYRRAAGVNLAQLRVGAGDWEGAVEGYELAATAQGWLLEQARTTATRLGEIVAGADLAARHALALAMAGRPADAVAELERNRVLMARDMGGLATPTRGEPWRAPGLAIAHLATSGYGTLGILERPDGELRTFTTALRLSQLTPTMRALLEATDGEERSSTLHALMELLGPGVVEPLAELLAAIPEPIAQLAIVACGGLASAPLHCVPDADGRSLGESYELHNLVSAAVVQPTSAGRPDVAVAVVDPDGTLPFARGEREGLERWARSTLGPPADRPLTPWLRDALVDADVAHIACHAHLDAEDPMRSSFELGAGAQLSVADLAELDSVDLDLLVAPACQAASASPDAPDELLGIGHALIHVGVRTVIASLWDADDVATALVVARLYHELGAGLCPAEALSRAQRFVATLGSAEMSSLARARLQEADEAGWLPYDLATELLALTAHPRFRSNTDPVFGDAAEWAALSCLEA
jgi:hypothetical protein